MKGVVHDHILRYSKCTHLPMFLACVHHLVIVVVFHVVEEDLLVPGMEIWEWKHWNVSMGIEI